MLNYQRVFLVIKTQQVFHMFRVGCSVRNLRTIHMHLEGPGPIPVDDPEAAQCAAERPGKWLGLGWVVFWVPWVAIASFNGC